MSHNIEGIAEELEQARGNVADAEAHIGKLEARIDKLEDLLEDLREWFDERADADSEAGHWRPNPEMQMLTRIREVLR